ncbi:hypothetical protein TI39_contig5829g00023 [Zymoseptoria brevis]|uniref:Uncharacterized protein n=1 Tax=Zymoseptoria brevis TaxID=1047168 RepID=A0A0F4G5X7_9PEZI|nr:hypothetical protein TI39_contig5829g00023 [Zymoseptoria brevis]
MASAVHPQQTNGLPKNPTVAGARPPVKKPYTPAKRQQVNGARTAATQNSARPVPSKAASIAGETGGGVTSAYAIMASRIANRVAEMAESITFVERPQQQPSSEQPAPPPTTETEKRRPRKLEMRLPSSSPDSIAFSAPFLDNTLQKMLQLQNRMLKSTAELSKSQGVDEKLVKEHASQSAELSRIVALICAEKARQGA